MKDWLSALPTGEDEVSVNILVTGGAGYIGAHCCKELASRGHHPITLDNLVYGHRRAVRWGPFYEGDLADRKMLDTIFEKERIEAVMHFAAFAYVGESMSEPQKYYGNNLRNTIGLLDVMLAHRVKHFIFSSTCATYGDPQYVPIDEEHPRLPISPYGKSKYMIEEILADYSDAYGLQFISLRYFNAAGADPEGEIGEDHTPETHLIPLVLDVAAGRSSAVQVFGADYETEDGTCVRDYIHVSDLAAAHVLALEYLLQSSPSDFINLGSGTGFTVLQVIEAAESITGRKIRTTAAQRRPGDPPVLLASNDKACRILGWKPRSSHLEEIIQTAWNWHKDLDRPVDETANE